MNDIRFDEAKLTSRNVEQFWIGGKTTQPVNQELPESKLANQVGGMLNIQIMHFPQFYCTDIMILHYCATLYLRRNGCLV